MNGSGVGSQGSGSVIVEDDGQVDVWTEFRSIAVMCSTVR